jgi:hypothetical protein
MSRPRPQNYASFYADQHAIDPGTRDLSPLFFTEDGHFRILSAQAWRNTTQTERSLLATKHALYVLPTTELVARLKELIGDRHAIEIGSGNGVLAAALDIPATDNHMQEWPRYRAIYAAMGQPTIEYGANVETLDALEAVKKYQPQVVLAAWVTHKYEATRHDNGGNEVGVPEEAVIDQVESYILVGHTAVHRHKSIWKLPHSIEYPDWLYSRALTDGRNFIAVWSRREGST